MDLGYRKSTKRRSKKKVKKSIKKEVKAEVNVKGKTEAEILVKWLGNRMKARHYRLSEQLAHQRS